MLIVVIIIIITAKVGEGKMQTYGLAIAISWTTKGNPRIVSKLPSIQYHRKAFLPVVLRTYNFYHESKTLLATYLSNSFLK